MDLRRLRIGEWASGAVGLLLLVSLFLPWYDTTGGSVTGFEALSVIDAILVIVAVLAVAVVPVTAAGRTPSAPLAFQSLLWLLALVGAVLAVIRVIDSPFDGASTAAGAWLGAVAAVALLVTLLVAMRDERLSTAGRLTDSTGAPIAAAPEIDTLPAPRA